MKKAILFAAVSLMSNVAMARGGNGGGNGVQVPARGSQAWFVSESIEHSIRNLIASGTGASEVVSAQAETTGTAAQVVIGLTGGAVANFACQMVDEFSRGGTVQKKEVFCVKN